MGNIGRTDEERWLRITWHYGPNEQRPENQWDKGKRILRSVQAIIYFICKDKKEINNTE
jgi:hypothetical protein